MSFGSSACSGTQVQVRHTRALSFRIECTCLWSRPRALPFEGCVHVCAEPRTWQCAGAHACVRRKAPARPTNTCTANTLRCAGATGRPEARVGADGGTVSGTLSRRLRGLLLAAVGSWSPPAALQMAHPLLSACPSGLSAAPGAPVPCGFAHGLYPALAVPAGSLCLKLGPPADPRRTPTPAMRMAGWGGVGAGGLGCRCD